METDTTTDIKGFFKSLYDFKFVSLIASRFMRFLYKLAVIVYTIFYGLLVLATIAKIPLAVIVLVPLYFLTIIWLRFVVEFLIVFFQMGEDVHSIRLRGASMLGGAIEAPQGIATNGAQLVVAEVSPVDNTPAGWYDAPSDPTQLRYWDGKGWTEHHSPKASPQPT